MPATTKQPAQFSALIPFAGFYASWHDQAIDDAEEQLFSDDDGEVFNQKLYEMFWSNLDYSIVHQKYAKAFVDLLATKLGFPLEFEEMTSPREYNFGTDRLFAKLNGADLAKMLRVLREVCNSSVWTTRLDDKITEECTSRSGFISSYPNRISLWPRIANWDHNHVGIVLSCYCDLMREQSKLPLEEEMVDEISADCAIEDMLASAAEGKAARALSINDYLRQRKERAYRHLPALVTT